jgi:hypothetical protein
VVGWAGTPAAPGITAATETGQQLSGAQLVMPVGFTGAGPAPSIGIDGHGNALALATRFTSSGHWVGMFETIRRA